MLVQEIGKPNLKGYEDLVGQTENVPGVVAATPFIYKQVLLSSPTGVQGIILRGIDPPQEAKVTDLEKNLIQGNLSDLEHPPPGIRTKGKIRYGYRSKKIFFKTTQTRHLSRQRIGQPPEGDNRKFGQCHFTGRENNGFSHDTKNSPVLGCRNL